MNWRTKLLLAVTVVVAVAGGVRWLGQSSEPASAQEGPAREAGLTQACVSASDLRGIFFWYASQPWDEAWLDLSLQDNGFIPGTFVAYGPVPAALNGGETDPARHFFAIVRWEGINQDLLQYWRVNLRYGDRWYPSTTQGFISQDCGGGPVTAPPSSDVSDLGRRLGTLEDCLGRLPPNLCSSRLDDIEARLDDLESRVDNLERRVRDLQ